MPQSRTRYQRAAKRSKYRKPKRRRSGSSAWNVAIVAVILVFSLLVWLAVLDRNGSSAGSGPPHAPNQAANVAGDHWHTALDINICGEWLAAAPAFEKPADNPNQLGNAGIHSHADGLIHTHPFVNSEEGKNATIGKFFTYGGWGLSADSIDLGGAISTDKPQQWSGPKSDPTKTKWSNGDVCPFGQYKGEKVQLTWAVDGKTKTGNPADYHQQDGETMAIYVLPKGADMPFPPAACTSFAQISDASQVVLSKNSPCRDQTTATTTPGAAPSTISPATTTSTP